MSTAIGFLSRQGLRAALCSVAIGLAVSTAIAAPAKTAARPGPVIPKPFQGEWYTEAQTCGHDMMEAFIINDTTTESGEDDGTVVAVKVLSPTHIIVTTDEMGEATADTPPGTSPSAGRLKSDYQLTGNGSRLKIRFGRNAPMNFVRCSPEPPQTAT